MTVTESLPDSVRRLTSESGAPIAPGSGELLAELRAIRELTETLVRAQLATASAARHLDARVARVELLADRLTPTVRAWADRIWTSRRIRARLDKLLGD